MLPKKLAFVDIETTGLSPGYNRIIEIGILRVEDNAVISTYQTLINPGCAIPSIITSITGISSSDVRNAPAFSAVHEEILEILDDTIFVAHNAQFDYGFIRNEFALLGKIYSAKKCCTVRLARRLFPGLRRYNLDTIISHFGIPYSDRHRALGDATVLWKFYQKLQQDVPLLALYTAIEASLR